MAKLIFSRAGGLRPAAADLRADAKLVLHVGCGPAHPESLHPQFRGPEWREIRLDIDPGVKPDVVASIVDMSNVKPESVDAIWSSHNLEHVYSHEVPVVLRNFFRVLRPGGEALITMPDLQQVAQLVARGKLEDVAYQSPAGPIAPLDILYGHRASVQQGNEFMSHRTGFTARTLTQKLTDAGFVDVTVTAPKDFSLWASARKPGRTQA
jgi:SAM-dependent methyltransferase